MPDTSTAAPGVETLVNKIGSTLRQWGPLSVPTLSVKLGVAPLHIRDAIDVSDGALVVEGDLVHRRESCTLTAGLSRSRSKSASKCLPLRTWPNRCPA